MRYLVIGQHSICVTWENSVILVTPHLPPDCPMHIGMLVFCYYHGIQARLIEDC